jgi:alanyl-tRNA synthetase
MTTNEIRSAYIKFFADRGHTEIPRANLVPEGDATTLFTGSGMQPLLPYLLGQDHPQGQRLVDSQPCFRAEDIDEVGDNRHTTFFEMLGNWSLGDYFKAEQLPWFWQFLTDTLKLDPKRLYVSVFAGEGKIDRDDDSVRIWQEIYKKSGIEATAVTDAATKGMQGGRIFYYDASKNWWSRAGQPANMPVV